MKNILLLASLFLVVLSTNAQTVIYSDNFEGYADNIGAALINAPQVGPATPMLVWEGTGRVYTFGSPNIPSYAVPVSNGSNNFALLNPNSANATNGKYYYFRKEGLSVLAGTTYIFSVKTYGSAGKDHKIGVNYGVKANYITHQDSVELRTATMSVVPFTETEWKTREIEFTPTEYQAAYPLNVFITIGTTGQVFIDDIKVYEKPATSGINKVTATKFKIARTSTEGVFEVKGSDVLASYSVVDVKGIQLKQSIANSNQINLSNIAKGIYILRLVDENGNIENHKIVLN